MKVILKDSVYEMTRQQFDGVLDVAAKSMERGIYAVEKDEIAEMKNEPYPEQESMMVAVKAYKEQGFTVYWKG